MTIYQYNNELRKDLRGDYKGLSLNRFGKLIKDLNIKEKKIILEQLLNENIKFFSSEKEQFKNFFKKIFEKEIKEIKKTL